ncbi:MAG: hypothetical protein R2731_07880 [Nocardioides sp.]
MCDTLVHLGEDGVLFAKNSDRDPNEGQALEWYAAAEHPAGATLECTWIGIPQVAATRAILVSRPWWLWGAEIGANEAGVVIGNEAVFTKARREGPGLLGMDLLRLALERAGSAEEAVQVIVTLLEAHGQGGSCSHDHPRFSYDNSFLVADPGGAIVLETAGRVWATEVVTGPGRSISNGLTIEGFAGRHSDRLRSRVAACEARRRVTQPGGAAATGPADLMRLLRSHGGGAGPDYRLLTGSMTPCMHAGGLLASSQTTASWVADLRGAEPVHWATLTAAPCLSLFKPFRLDQPADLGPMPTQTDDGGASRWWRHERLHRAVVADYAALAPAVQRSRDEIEAEWLTATPPATGEALARDDAWEARTLAALPPSSRRDRRPVAARARWRTAARAAAASR